VQRPIVFLVDGFAEEREMYAEYLTLTGFDVRAFDNPDDAIRAVKIAAPAAVIARIRQPSSAMDGLALAALVRAEAAAGNAAIIAITSSSLRSVHESAIRAGCDACLRLPTMPDDLVRTLQAILRARSFGQAPSAENTRSSWS
jgi:CheY-like chemotaxis protein